MVLLVKDGVPESSGRIAKDGCLRSPQLVSGAPQSINGKMLTPGKAQTLQQEIAPAETLRGSSTAISGSLHQPIVLPDHLVNAVAVIPGITGIAKAEMAIGETAGAAEVSAWVVTVTTVVGMAQVVAMTTTGVAMARDLKAVVTMGTAVAEGLDGVVMRMTVVSVMTATAAVAEGLDVVMTMGTAAVAEALVGATNRALVFMGWMV